MSQDLVATLLYRKTLGCLLGGLIGDAVGTPTEGVDYRDIEAQFGWVDDFSSDGTLLASGSHDDTLRLWGVGSWQEKDILNHSADWTVFFAPDDAHIATEDGTIWDIASGEKVRSLDARQSHVTFSPDGAWMASAGYNAPIDIWDVETWQVVQTLEGHTDRVFGMAFAPDGSLLASGGYDNKVYLWGTSR